MILYLCNRKHILIIIFSIRTNVGEIGHLNKNVFILNSSQAMSEWNKYTYYKKSENRIKNWIIIKANMCVRYVFQMTSYIFTKWDASGPILTINFFHDFFLFKTYTYNKILTQTCHLYEMRPLLKFTHFYLNLFTRLLLFMVDVVWPFRSYFDLKCYLKIEHKKILN